jgi:hypothetical protein
MPWPWAPRLGGTTTRTLGWSFLEEARAANLSRFRPMHEVLTAVGAVSLATCRCPSGRVANDPAPDR